MLTPKQVEKYLESPGNCPFCGSKKWYEWGFEEIDGMEVKRELECDSCQKSWREYFKLHDIEELDEDGAAIPNEGGI